MPIASRRGVLSRSRQTPSFRAASLSYDAEGGGSVRILQPAGTAEGDLMLAFIAGRSSSIEFGAPDGWDEVLINNPPAAGIAVYRHVASAIEPDECTFHSSGGGSAKGGLIASYVGSNQADPIDVSNSANAKDSTSNLIAPSLVTTGPAERLVCVYTVDQLVTWTKPAGTDQRFAGTTTEFTTSFLLVDQLVPVAGATGTKTAVRSTATSQYEFGVALALNAA